MIKELPKYNLNDNVYVLGSREQFTIVGVRYSIPEKSYRYDVAVNFDIGDSITDEKIENAALKMIPLTNDSNDWKWFFPEGLEFEGKRLKLDGSMRLYNGILYSLPDTETNYFIQVSVSENRISRSIEEFIYLEKQNALVEYETKIQQIEKKYHTNE